MLSLLVLKAIRKTSLFMGTGVQLVNVVFIIVAVTLLKCGTWNFLYITFCVFSFLPFLFFYRCL